MSDSNNKTSLLVKKQLPAFVRDEYDLFVKFLQYYYQFLEQDGGLTYVSKNFNNYLNIDLIKQDIDEDNIGGEMDELREETDYHAFLQKMYDNFISLIPDTALADRSLIAKHAKEFYSSRGTERSVSFLLRSLYNKEATYYYPKSDVIKASDGKWYIERSLKVTGIAVNNVSNTLGISNFTSKTVYGTHSNASATVESVDSYYEKGVQVTELKLSNIYKNFQQNESIYCLFPEEGYIKFLSANLFSGIVSSAQLNAPGAGYTAGTSVPIRSGTGSGAQIVISSVTYGPIQGVGVTFGGAGFLQSDPLLISGTGTGAAGNVAQVDASGQYHPNTYNVVWSTIALEANTPIGNAIYSNLVPSIVDPANNWIANSMSYFVYGPTGPASSVTIATPGSNYVPPVSVSISANSIISKLGILGRMKIINGGINYAVGDNILFVNPPGGTGSGAIANVTGVDPSGTITSVAFKTLKGQITGGSGYDYANFPTTTVSSVSGSGANIAVTALIGHNESLIISSGSVGAIEGIKVISGGSGYQANDWIDLSGLGNGQANATLGVVSGIYTYPGRFIADDGQPSAYNFIQDRDYYQNFSYVVKIQETTNKYRLPLKNLTHPAGSKMFGEYTTVSDANTDTDTNVSVSYANSESIIKGYTSLYQAGGYLTGFFAPQTTVAQSNAETIYTTFTCNTISSLGQFTAQNNSIIVYSYRHSFNKNDKVFLKFVTNASPNIANSNYTVATSNLNYIFLTNPLSESATGNVGNVQIYRPDITVLCPYSKPNNGTNVYVQFANTLTNADATIYNGYYTVYGARDSVFNIAHPYMASSVSNANTIVIFNKKMTVTSANNHGYNVGDQAYLKFLTGDRANTVNGYYTVTEVGDANSFNIVGANLVFAGGQTRVFGRSGTISVAGTNTFANGNTAYISFASGDQGNTTNGIYYPIVTGPNILSFNTAKPATANAYVRIWSSQNSYSNIKITTIRSSYFTPGTNVAIQFFASATDLANGIYSVNSSYFLSNSFNIVYLGNTSTYSFSGNTYSNNQIYTHDNTMSYIVYSGLGVTPLSQMEGTCQILLYK